MFRESLYDRSPVLFQHVMCSLKGLQIRRQRYTKRFWGRLDFLMKSRLLSESAMASYQLDRFNQLLDFATRTVPHYRNLLASGKIPKAIGDLAEITAFPTLDKATVRSRTADFVTDDTSRRYIVLPTSGSTGTPLNVTLCEDGLIDIFAMLWRQRREFGVEFGDPTATFNGRSVVPVRQSGPPFWRRNVFMNQTLFSQYHTSPENLRHYCEELKRRPFRLWFGYPSFIGLVAAYMEKHDIRLETPPQLVQTGSETLFASLKERIAHAVHTNVKDNYGCMEGCVSISECRDGKMHVDREMSIVEVEPLQEDSRTTTGHLIVTGLSNYGMPLIRYRIGDIGTLCKDPCECGRIGPVFERIEGRIEDVIVTPRGSCVGQMNHLLKEAKHIVECQLVQNDINTLIVNVVRTPEYTSTDEKYVSDRIATLLGDEIRPVFNYVETIPRLGNGKFRAVVNNMSRTGTPGGHSA